MNSLHVKRNDMVVVLSGADRGKIAKVLATFPREATGARRGRQPHSQGAAKDPEQSEGRDHREGGTHPRLPGDGAGTVRTASQETVRRDGRRERVVELMPQLYEHYKKGVVEQLMKNGRYTNRMQVPKVEKVVVNMGINSNHEKDVLTEAQQELATITGQKAVVTKAKKSISNFKVRKDMPVGAKVTLRGARMYEFLERFFNAALPRIRDFRGVNPRGFDGRGSYTMGVRDQTIFPEVELDKIKHNLGMDVTIVTTASTDAEAKELLKLLGMPFSS